MLTVIDIKRPFNHESLLPIIDALSVLVSGLAAAISAYDLTSFSIYTMFSPQLGPFDIDHILRRPERIKFRLNWSPEDVADEEVFSQLGIELELLPKGLLKVSSTSWCTLIRYPKPKKTILNYVLVSKPGSSLKMS